MDKKTNNKIGKRQVIQYMVDKCRESSGTFNYFKRVQMLRDFVCLEIPELKPGILEKEKQLKHETKLKIMKLFKDDPNEYMHPVKKRIHEIAETDEFYTELFDEIEKNNN